MSEPLFSERHDPEKREQYHNLNEGIPDFLFPSLLDWTIEHYRRSLFGKRTPDRQMILRLERKTRRTLPSRAKDHLNELERVFRLDDALLLSAIDLVLRDMRHYTFEDRTPEELQNILEEAASVYCVGKDGDDNFQLQFRQPEELTRLIQTETDQPGRASAHLRRAWSKCYSLTPDTNDACSEAVKAIEVVAKSVVIPNDPKATLGKMCKALHDKPEKWVIDSELGCDVETVLDMMELVWNDGRFRHGDEDAPFEVSQEAAEMTVDTALILVSWFRSGWIRMKS